MNSAEVIEHAMIEGQKHFEWLDSLNGPMETPSVDTVEQACSLIWNRKGKRLRSHFVYWFSEPYGINKKSLELYSWAVEAIHTATLLHDDVIDKAEIRRSGPSANQVFDNTIPILSGDYLMSDAIHQLAIKGHHDLLKGMCQALKELTQGEVLQHQNQFKIPNSDSYYRWVCDLKTASLLKWAASVGPTLASSNDKPHAIQFAKSYGLLYQFTDDILDIRGTHTKEPHQDLREGKVNWAVWSLLQHESHLRDVLEKSFSKQQVPPGFSELLQHSLSKSEQQQHLNQVMSGLQKDCLKSIAAFDNSYVSHLLATLVEFTMSRVY